MAGSRAEAIGVHQAHVSCADAVVDPGLTGVVVVAMRISPVIVDARSPGALVGSATVPCVHVGPP